MSKPIFVVDAITLLGLAKSQPPLLILGARGRTRTSGWTHGQLLPRMYPAPPADGVQDFDFVAEPPTGISLPYLAPIASFYMNTAPSWLRGVRIHAETNEIERAMAFRAPPLFDADLSKASPGPNEGEGLTAADYGLASDMATTEIKGLLAPDVAIEFEELVDTFEVSAAAAGARCHDYTVARITGWPETKTEMEHKCIVKIGGKCRASMHVPVIYHRKSELRIIARVCLPSEDDLRKAIEDCIKEAVAAGILAGVLTGNLAAFAVALETYLKSCLAAKGVAAANQVSVRLSQNKTAGPWKRL